MKQIKNKIPAYYIMNVESTYCYFNNSNSLDAISCGINILPIWVNRTKRWTSWNLQNKARKSI